MFRNLLNVIIAAMMGGIGFAIASSVVSAYPNLWIVPIIISILFFGVSFAFLEKTKRRGIKEDEEKRE